MVQGSEIQKFVKRSAGVTAEVNLRNPLHADEEPGNRGINLGLKPRGDSTRRLK